MKKRCLGGIVVVVVLLLAGVAMAQPSPVHILHKYGQIYDGDTGTFDLSAKVVALSPDGWAVDFLYSHLGVSILHRYGGVWTTGSGWDLSAHFAGIDYARALEHLHDLSGCWCCYSTGWEFGEDEFGAIYGNHYFGYYPEEYVQIDQAGRLLTAQHCEWNGADWDCMEVGGMVYGSHIVLSGGEPPAADSCWWTHHLVGQYYWDETRGCWAMTLGHLGSDFYCQGAELGEEEGNFGSIMLFQKYQEGETGPWLDCQCPPEID